MERSIKEQVGAATWESWPVGARMAIADAQATIAALQARVQQMESDKAEKDKATWERVRLIDTLHTQLSQRTAERDTARRRVDELEAREVDVVMLREDLEQRTAELEAARTALNALRDGYDDLESRHSDAQAELGRVRDQFADLRKMVAALPKVEGAVVVSNGYVKDSTRCHALFGADEDAALYAALLQHRQEMEG